MNAAGNVSTSTVILARNADDAALGVRTLEADSHPGFTITKVRPEPQTGSAPKAAAQRAAIAAGQLIRWIVTYEYDLMAAVAVYQQQLEAAALAAQPEPNTSEYADQRAEDDAVQAEVMEDDANAEAWYTFQTQQGRLELLARQETELRHQIGTASDQLRQVMDSRSRILTSIRDEREIHVRQSATARRVQEAMTAEQMDDQLAKALETATFVAEAHAGPDGEWVVEASDLGPGFGLRSWPETVTVSVGDEHYAEFTYGSAVKYDGELVSVRYTRTVQGEAQTLVVIND